MLVRQPSNPDAGFGLEAGPPAGMMEAACAAWTRNFFYILDASLMQGNQPRAQDRRNPGFVFFLLWQLISCHFFNCRKPIPLLSRLASAKLPPTIAFVCLRLGFCVGNDSLFPNRGIVPYHMVETGPVASKTAAAMAPPGAA